MPDRGKRGRIIEGGLRFGARLLTSWWTSRGCRSCGSNGGPAAPRRPIYFEDSRIDVIANVMITDVTLRWLYHPYDGGMDVILPTTAERNSLRRRHSEWLSTHPTGL
jgi:hypothetical protein